MHTDSFTFHIPRPSSSMKISPVTLGNLSLFHPVDSSYKNISNLGGDQDGRVGGPGTYLPPQIQQKKSKCGAILTEN